MNKPDDTGIAFYSIICKEFTHNDGVYYELMFRRPIGCRANFPSPIDGKRN